VSCLILRHTSCLEVFNISRGSTMPPPRRKRTTFIWDCCFCNHKGLSIKYLACSECDIERCAYCPTKKIVLNNTTTTQPLFNKTSPHGTSPQNSSPPEAVPAILASLAVSYPRAKKRYLSILIHGILVETCCADSGSDVNCITSNFARSIGVALTKKVTYFSLPVKSSA
jgi:hypothetical protein